MIQVSLLAVWESIVACIEVSGCAVGGVELVGSIVHNTTHQYWDSLCHWQICLDLAYTLLKQNGSFL
jgi:hypothetical protein